MSNKNVFEPGSSVCVKAAGHLFEGVSGVIESVHDMSDGTKCAKLTYDVLASLGPTMLYREVLRDGEPVLVPAGQENTDAPRLAVSTMTRHSFYARLADLRPAA